MFFSPLFSVLACSACNFLLQVMCFDNFRSGASIGWKIKQGLIINILLRMCSTYGNFFAERSLNRRACAYLIVVWTEAYRSPTIVIYHYSFTLLCFSFCSHFAPLLVKQMLNLLKYFFELCKTTGLDSAKKPTSIFEQRFPEEGSTTWAKCGSFW